MILQIRSWLTSAFRRRAALRKPLEPFVVWQTDPLKIAETEAWLESGNDGSSVELFTMGPTGGIVIPLGQSKALLDRRNGGSPTGLSA